MVRWVRRGRRWWHGTFPWRPEHQDPCSGGCRRAPDPDCSDTGPGPCRTAAEELSANLKPGRTLLADKAYDSNAIREQVQEQDVWANIPPKSNRKGAFAFSAFLYRYRNLIERFFNKFKQFRAVATRYDNDPDNFLAAIKLISARIWIRSY
jgi:transposase